MPRTKRIERQVLPAEHTTALTPRDDLVLEDEAVSTAAGGVTTTRFGLAEGPLTHYARTVVDDGTTVHETTEYRLAIPWFRWLFAWPVSRALKARHDPGVHPGSQPWWAPPDRLEPRQAMLLAKLRNGAAAADARMALEVATIGGAGCLGRIGEIGSLAVGAVGDVAIWSLTGPAFAGAIADPIEAWLRCGPLVA
ncbi:MAG TPA: amidohydrolase family protein, partial [Ilumatobacteraceae bacterium]|nr:amidohydrolase family protein [Ilumatobacteraceae bacterium]